MKKLFKQIIRFGIVGFLCFFIEYGILVFLTEVAGINYLISNACGFSVAVLVNYILSIVFVFDANKERSRFKEFIVFLLFSIGGLGINQFVMWFAVEFLGIHYMLSKIGATAIVMVYNFITRKLFIEKH